MSWIRKRPQNQSLCLHRFADRFMIYTSYIDLWYKYIIRGSVNIRASPPLFFCVFLCTATNFLPQIIPFPSLPLHTGGTQTNLLVSFKLAPRQGYISWDKSDANKRVLQVIQFSKHFKFPREDWSRTAPIQDKTHNTDCLQVLLQVTKVIDIFGDSVQNCSTYSLICVGHSQKIILHNSMFS